MKLSIAVFLIMLGTISYSQTKSYDYAYQRGTKIYVYSAADKKEVLVTGDGVNPAISPDGRKLAYTIDGKEGKMGPTRFIGIIDLSTKAKTVLNTRNNNCYGPVWSSDGKWIAYNAYKKDSWSIAIISIANNSTPRVIINNAFSPHWLPGDKGIILQNMHKIMICDATGKIIANYSMHELEKGVPELKNMVGNASNDDFIFTNDGKKMVFNCMVDEDGEGGPPSAVFVYDFSSRKTLRISPKGYSANNLAVKGNEVFFAASKIKSAIVNIYKVDADGKNYKLLFEKSHSISVRL